MQNMVPASLYLTDNYTCFWRTLKAHLFVRVCGTDPSDFLSLVAMYKFSNSFTYLWLLTSIFKFDNHFVKID